MLACISIRWNGQKGKKDLGILWEERRLDKSDLRLNLKEFGYDKLLGRGRIEYPVFVEVEEASKKAIDKIKNKGGDVKVQQF